MKSMGLPEFFALEAVEYLDRLDEIASQDRTPGQDLVRYARALRGAALMARQEETAAAAKRFEQFAKAVIQGEKPWDDAARALVVRTLDDFRALVRTAGSWKEEDERRAASLIESLRESVGDIPRPTEAEPKSGLDPGAREFVAREGRAIAEALERAAESLATDPTNLTLVDEALRSMQALRGLRALQDLEPPPSILTGIESAIGDIAAGAIDDPGALFRAAARAVAQAAREVSESGTLSADSADAREFAERLGQGSAPSSDIVPVEALFFDDSGPHVIEQGEAPGGPSSLSALQIVSHGEHLRAAADDFERAHSSTQRELLSHTLGSTLRTLGDATGGALPTAIASFALAARDRIARGSAVEEPTAFAAQLRAAGDVMRRAGEESEEKLAGDLRTAAAAVARIRHAAEPAPALPTAAEPAAPTEPPAELAATVTPPPEARESAAEAVPEPPTAPAALDTFEIPAGSEMEREPGLAGAWASYVRLTVESARKPAATLSEFLAARLDGAAEPERAPPAPVAAEPAVVASVTMEPTPVAPEPEVEAELTVPEPQTAAPLAQEPEPVAAPTATIGPDDVVPIENLLYDGRTALLRVRELKLELQRVREPKRAELLDELFDLVDLAITASG